MEHQIHPISDEAIEDDYGEYVFAAPVGPLEGLYVIDCWLVNKDGEVHPGYSVSPVPIRVQYLGEPQFVLWPWDEDLSDAEFLQRYGFTREELVRRQLLRSSPRHL